MTSDSTGAGDVRQYTRKGTERSARANEDGRMGDSPAIRGGRSMCKRTSAYIVLAAALSLLAPDLCSEARPSAAQPKPAEASDPLAELNEHSRAAYRRAREEALTRVGPVVLV